jgi:hypothetical protein
LHDIVVIDWVGYYCDDTTKRRLNIPSAATSTTTTTTTSTHTTGSRVSIDDNVHPDDKEHVERHEEKQEDLHHHEDSHNDASTTTPTLLQQQQQVEDILHTLPKFHVVENLYCCIGDQDLIPAVEMGLRFMNVVVTTTNIPPTDVERDVELRAADDECGNTIPTVAWIYSHSKYAYGLSTRTYTYSAATPVTATTNDTSPTSKTSTTTTTDTLPHKPYSRIVISPSGHTCRTGTRRPEYNIIIIIIGIITFDSIQKGFGIITKGISTARNNVQAMNGHEI